MDEQFRHTHHWDTIMTNLPVSERQRWRQCLAATFLEYHTARQRVRSISCANLGRYFKRLWSDQGNSSGGNVQAVATAARVRAEYLAISYIRRKLGRGQ